MTEKKTCLMLSRTHLITGVTTLYDVKEASIAEDADVQELLSSVIEKEVKDCRLQSFRKGKYRKGSLSAFSKDIYSYTLDVVDEDDLKELGITHERLVSSFHAAAQITGFEPAFSHRKKLSFFKTKTLEEGGREFSFDVPAADPFTEAICIIEEAFEYAYSFSEDGKETELSEKFSSFAGVFYAIVTCWISGTIREFETGEERMTQA